MFEDLTIRQYNDILASKAPTPGGGSALAQVGAVACSLVEMAINVTLSKMTAGEDYDYLKSQCDVAMRAKKTMYKLSNDDAQAFEKIIVALHMPQSTDEEKKRRSQQLQKAYHRAAIVPLDLMALCREILRLAKVRVMPNLSKYVSSDCVIAIDLLKNIATNSLVNVRANTTLIVDPTLQSTLDRQAMEILNEIEKI